MSPPDHAKADPWATTACGWNVLHVLAARRSEVPLVVPWADALDTGPARGSAHQGCDRAGIAGARPGSNRQARPGICDGSTLGLHYWVKMSDPDDIPEYTPLGLAVRAWFPLIAILSAASAGGIAFLASGSAQASVLWGVLMVAALLFGFYVRPLRRSGKR